MKSKILLAVGIGLVCVVGLFSAISSAKPKSTKPSLTTELVHQMTTQAGTSVAR